MTPARPLKAQAKGPATPDLLALLKPALDRAIVALQDPVVREQIYDKSRFIADAVRKWRAEHDDPTRGAASEGRLAKAGRALGRHFGQRRLERRLSNLQASIETLMRSRSELAESLEPVATTIEQLAVALELAGGLPVVKRKLAHRKIDDALDKLENSLFSAALPSPASE